MHVWTWDVLGPAGKRVWTLMFACYYLDGLGIPRPHSLAANVVAAADEWRQEKDRDPHLVEKRSVSADRLPVGGWLPPPPASSPREDVPPSALLSDDEQSILRRRSWDALSSDTQESLALRMAVMQHLAEFDAAPTDLVAQAARAPGRKRSLLVPNLEPTPAQPSGPPYEARAADSVSLDALPWPSDAAGVGALLMIDPDLPRDQFQHPYQPLFWFDEHSRPVGLVVDGAGHVLAWRNSAQGDPYVVNDPRCQRVPVPVEDAARRWWAEQRSAR